MRKFHASLAVWMTLLIGPPRSSAAPAGPTFTKDVAPILYKNCAGCHRPGDIAPMSLLDYQSARPWAKSIREAVLSRQMPPWFADPKPRRVRQRSAAVPPRDFETIRQWVDSGSPEGNPRDLPPRRVRPRLDTWQARHRHRHWPGFRSAAGQRRVRVLHRAHQLHGGQVDSRGGDPAGEPAGGAPRARQPGRRMTTDRGRLRLHAFVSNQVGTGMSKTGCRGCASMRPCSMTPAPPRRPICRI